MSCWHQESLLSARSECLSGGSRQRVLVESLSMDSKERSEQRARQPIRHRARHTQRIKDRTPDANSVRTTMVLPSVGTESVLQNGNLNFRSERAASRNHFNNKSVHSALYTVDSTTTIKPYQIWKPY